MEYFDIESAAREILSAGRMVETEALTLEKGDGEQVEVAIASITERRAGLSAMPGDLEQALDRFEMRDLIESLSRR